MRDAGEARDGAGVGGAGSPQPQRCRVRLDTVHDRRDAHADGDRGTTRDPAVRGRARLDAHAEGPLAMTITAAAARRILRRQGMPSREIRAILEANDPLVVRRLLELHRERLEEWLEE